MAEVRDQLLEALRPFAAERVAQEHEQATGNSARDLSIHRDLGSADTLYDGTHHNPVSSFCFRVARPGQSRLTGLSLGSYNRPPLFQCWR